MAMSDVTRILDAIRAGDAQAAEQLLPLVYDELRKLAAARLDKEKPGQTLTATALVHEAYLRLLPAQAQAARWDGCGHFFAAAAEAMRRILIDNARRKGRVRRGGARQRVDLDEAQLVTDGSNDDLLDLDDALTRLADLDPVRAELVKLRFFAGLTMQDAADILCMSVRSAQDVWAYARSWLHHYLREE